jgi:regulator of sigma E protease
VSWVWAFCGFAALVILHEAGHFTAAKLVGMRVERFSLFFPPLLARVKKGETEYAIGAIPLGGYVKITGMNPGEEIPPEHEHRAYYRQPPWKRIVVIAAGPFVNIVLAFAIFAAIAMSDGALQPPPVVGKVEAGSPAAGKLKPGDEVLAIDGARLTGNFDAQVDQIGKAVAGHHGTPVTVTVKRAGQPVTVTGSTFYDKATKRYRFGFGYDSDLSTRPVGPVKASSLAVSTMWSITSQTVSHIAQIFKPEERKQLGSVVGGYEQTRQAFKLGARDALIVLAFISLSLGVINLFPFLPLDGGHIFWALAEKVRGRAIPFAVMERAGFIGFALVLGLFMIGLTNDIGRLSNGGFDIR